MSEPYKLKKALKPKDIMNKKYKTLDIGDDWKKSIGIPEASGSWLIFGDSGNGKTRFLLQLCKHLSKFKKVAYNPLEEGTKFSLATSLKDVEMSNPNNNITFLQQETLAELRQRIALKRSPDIYIIDSLQYLMKSPKNYKPIDIRDYKKLLRDFPDKLFIINSHAEGNFPAGATGKAIRFDADIKIRVEGYKAFFISRFGGNEDYTIWKKGAEQYWTKKQN